MLDLIVITTKEDINKILYFSTLIHVKNMPQKFISLKIFLENRYFVKY